MHRLFFSFLFSVSCLSTLHAATVDTVEIYSRAMHKNSKCVVISPAVTMERVSPLAVVYLLHGYSGNFSNWLA